MKGNIKVVVSTKKLRYELNLRRNITIIQGDSATGKTTLIQIINDYLTSRTGPGTDVICKKKCAVLSGDLESVLIRLERLSDTIVFANEQEHFLYPKRFAAAVLKSDCYFVFITRDDLHTLPYSVNEIYCLKNSGYYQNTRQVYNSLHQIYPESQVHDMIAPTMILTEDIVDVQGETRLKSRNFGDFQRYPQSAYVQLQSSVLKITELSAFEVGESRRDKSKPLLGT